MNLERLLKRRNDIYGFLAIWIVVFHCYRNIGMSYIPGLTHFVSLGNISVDIFFFLSGLCLTLSCKKQSNPNWKKFFKRRFQRILIPYLIISIPYYAWNALVEHSGSILKKTAVFLANVSTLSWWINGSATTWYVSAIILFYLLFPVLYLHIRQSIRKSIIILLAAFAFAIISAYIPVINKCILTWARLPIYITGIIIGVYIDDIMSFLNDNIHKRRVIFCAIICIIVLVCGLTINEVNSLGPKIKKVWRYILYYPITISIIVLLSTIPNFIHKSLFSYIGSLSLEIYLIHITILHPMKFYGWIDYLGTSLYFILPIIAIAISIIINLISRKINALISKNAY